MRVFNRRDEIKRNNLLQLSDAYRMKITYDPMRCMTCIESGDRVLVVSDMTLAKSGLSIDQWVLLLR